MNISKTFSTIGGVGRMETGSSCTYFSNCIVWILNKRVNIWLPNCFSNFEGKYVHRLMRLYVLVTDCLIIFNGFGEFTCYSCFLKGSEVTALGDKVGSSFICCYVPFPQG